MIIFLCLSTDNLNVNVLLFVLLSRSTLTDLSYDWQVGALANKDDCLSGQYTSSGECCKQCQPGEGVEKPCGATQTVCAHCLDSE